MASFVQRLRMANMFPIRSDIGNAQVPVDNNDDMYDVINAGKNLFDYANRNRGIEEVGQQVRSAPQKIARPTFGGMVNEPGLNPGADILNRSKATAAQTYAGNTEELLRSRIGPQPGSEDVMGRDEAHLDRYMKRKNAETVANATAENAGMKGWKTVTTVDPNDPNKQISVQVNDRTGETRPLDIEGTVVRPGSAKDIQANIDAKKKSADNLESLRSRAKDSLALMDELLDPTSETTDVKTGQTSRKMNPTIGNVTGWSRMLGHGYLPEGQGSIAKLNRLKNNLTLDLIRDMKEKSKTGATGFGALNLKELGVLENSASMLDERGMEDEQYEAELNRIMQRLRMILQDEAGGSNTEVQNKSNTNSPNAPKAPEGFEYVRRPDNKGWTAIRKAGG